MLFLDIANGWKTAIMISLMFVVMYFFMIKPQRDRQKKDEEYRNGLKSGDRVMTTGGIHGTIASTEPGYVHLEVAPGVRMKVGKSAVMPIPTAKK